MAYMYNSSILWPSDVKAFFLEIQYIPNIRFEHCGVKEVRIRRLENFAKQCLAVIMPNNWHILDCSVYFMQTFSFPLELFQEATWQVIESHVSSWRMRSLHFLVRFFDTFETQTETSLTCSLCKVRQLLGT